MGNLQSVNDLRGPPGIQGPKGDFGSTGTMGPIGLTGPQGLRGLQGLQGIKGDLGTMGPIGLTGPQGPQGLQGLQGLQGIKGDLGTMGPIGLTGPQGLQGLQGLQGPQGIKGDIGLQGIGIQGATLSGDNLLFRLTNNTTIGNFNVRGPPGPIGPMGTTSFSALTDTQKSEVVSKLLNENTATLNNLIKTANADLKSSVMWCADGQICETPAGKNAYFSGNVGIGSSSPNAKLHVRNSNAGFDFPTVQILRDIKSNDISASQHGHQLEIGKLSDNKRIAIGVIDNGTGVVQVKESGVGYSSLSLNPVAGNVGVGTASPTSKLQINVPVDSLYNNLTANAAMIYGSGTTAGTTSTHAATVIINSTSPYGQNIGGSLGLGGRMNNYGGGNLHALFGRISGVQSAGTDAFMGDLTFDTQNNGILYERMRINRDGNVGVGINPTRKLDVNGALRVGNGNSYIMDLGTSGVGTSRAAYIYGDGTNMEINNQQNGNIILATNNGEKMRITNEGNVDVAGRLKVGGRDILSELDNCIKRNTPYRFINQENNQIFARNNGSTTNFLTTSDKSNWGRWRVVETTEWNT